ncbi:hypothetical protein [Geobacter sp.]|uniref:hypothetical protein n=1 Tax=Geobacter sp. TaxID=46610 RepID=UPI0026225234|nr:hypothetical protein [Geobacter sp.]
MDVRTALEKAIIANELSGNLAVAYRFSDPDGLRTGKSGYSFGRCQFDIFNNGRAIQCLLECGFTPAEIDRLKRQNGPIADLNAKLRAAAAIVDRYDASEIEHTIAWVREVCGARGITFANDEALVHACDYHNQFGMQAGGKAVTCLAALHRPVTAGDIKAYKLATAWGKKRPDDVERRFDNIVRIMRG